MVIYLDANAYIEAKYNFNNFHIRRLVKLIEESKVQLLVSKVTIYEVYDHIKKDVTEEVNAYKTVIRDKMPIVVKEGVLNLKEINVAEVVDGAQSKIRQFFDSTKVTKIPLDPMNMEQLIDDWYFKKPPFETTKPNEFKDAIMINAIRIYQKSLDESVIIISADKGVRKAFDGDSNFMTFAHLSEFLEFYFEQFKELDAGVFVAKEILEGSLDEAMKIYADDVEVYFTEYAEWDIEDKEVNNVKYEVKYISQEDNEIYVAAEATAEVTVEVMYRDEENSCYDKEDNIYYFERYILAKEKHIFDFEVGLNLDIEISNQSEFTLNKIELDKSYHKTFVELDDDTRIDSEIIRDSLNDY